MNLRNKNLGFSLIETLITLSLGTILMSYAVPSYKNFTANTRMSSATNLFVADLSAARSAAVTRGMPVAVCASTDQATCSGSAAWAAGWIVFTDADGGPGILDGDDELLHSAQPLSTNVSFATQSAYLRFGGLGSLEND